MKRVKGILFLAVGIAFSANTLLAAPIPDAGSILRDQAPRQEQQPRIAAPELKVVEPSKAEGGCVSLSKVSPSVVMKVL